MELDKRIKALTDIITCFNEDRNRAEQCVGQMGYFADDMMSFNNLEGCIYGKLETYSIDEDYPFRCVPADIHYSFFIPESVLKPKEKKYRPYTLNEFLKEIPMHTVITMRKKVDNDCIVTCTFTGYRTRCICTDVCLGVEWISLGTLADEYEYKNTYIGNWKPFGVEE